MQIYMTDKEKIRWELERCMFVCDNVLIQKDTQPEARMIYEAKKSAYEHILKFIDQDPSLHNDDLELITSWFEHIQQIADDRKTANGVVMEDWAALDEIKALAKDSIYYIIMHCTDSKNSAVKEDCEKFGFRGSPGYKNLEDSLEDSKDENLETSSVIDETIKASVLPTNVEETEFCLSYFDEISWITKLVKEGKLKLGDKIKLAIIKEN